ncbi:hypothetical protein EIL87_06255 [Saccharopolyspora rhizosphaerae]|uniref:DUF3040 domain-containing protein n=1 Tax=Saccharopolyspora rhizosphaerae TaxID=2492662 RepID=A0A426JZU1_9PSEU|nr:hypothetical protein EIL87_06255 [Saccharopolyspora rhizosphaerae]
MFFSNVTGAFFVNSFRDAIGPARVAARRALIEAGVRRHPTQEVRSGVCGYSDLDPNNRSPERLLMITLGVILLILGVLLKISILTTVGGILLLVGVVLFVLGRAGTKVGGRSHWF